MESKLNFFINQANEIITSSKNLESALKRLMHLFCTMFDRKDEVRLVLSFGDFFLYCEEKHIENHVREITFEIDGKHTGRFEIYSSLSTEEFSKKYKLEMRILDEVAKMFAYHYRNQVEIKIDDNKLKPLQSKTTIERSKNFYRDFIENYFERDIFHDLMPYKVKEILLIATLYDAYTIESEGNFTQQLAGDFSKLNLTSAPRVTAVNSYVEAEDKLSKRHYDMIIIMVGIDRKTPVAIAERLKESKYSFIPVYFLLNNNAYIKEFEDYKFDGLVENIFVWNGDSRIFFTMVKLQEDKINLRNDTEIGKVRIIMLVEDSIRYYSRYLPELYMNVFKQTQKLIEEVTTLDELYKVLRLRARPKILLASSYEEAKQLFDMYRPHFLSIITDVEFYRKGKTDKRAGFDLVSYVKQFFYDKDFPIIIQSSDLSNREKAYEIGCSFIYKNSDTLASDINFVLMFNMGFGDFIYKDRDGQNLKCPDDPGKECRAKTLDEFEKMLYIVPAESLMYHATRNHFSLWLRARGEIALADELSKLTTDDFDDAEDMRKFLIEKIKKIKYEKNKGKIVEFIPEELTNESNIVSLAPGALGGKGRGIAFIHTLIYKYGIDSRFDMKIKTPYTFIIGTDEYDNFLMNNNLKTFAIEENDYRKIREAFLKAKLSDKLIERLKIVLQHVDAPLAVRSSGLFEDSLMQPFAGIFETYIVPNSHPDFNVRLKQLTDAIKMVYASVFSEKSKQYINAISYKIEEEKMAVVIQKVIGHRYGDYYYPHISGVAQSYNYYPFSYIKPEDGFAAIALGLGMYVVEGEKAYRFCPKYPKLQNQTAEDIYNNSQTYFYAVDLRPKELNYIEGEDVGLAKLDVWDAEKHGVLKHLVSVYDMDTKTLIPGLDKPGPRVLDFADILKYNYVPLADTLVKILKISEEAMGSPVEVEFAVDLNKDENGKATFYLLQIKPLLGNEEDYNVNLDEIPKEKIIILTDKSMGNGKYENIKDIVFVKPETFDKHYTTEIAKEIASLNEQYVKKNENYILIGPGRWGTRDKWIGIPVSWPQISKAKIIIEMSLPGFPLDPSAGSHFFHIMVTMNVGYLSIYHNNPEHIVKWDLINQQKTIYESKFVKVVRFQEPFIVKLDGKKRIGVAFLI